MRKGLALIGWCAFAAFAAGCELSTNLTDLADQLGDPDPDTIDTDGRQIIEGSFRNVRFDGSNSDGVFVVAIEYPMQENEEESDDEKEAEPEPPPELRLIEFNSGEPCSAGPGNRYAGAVSRPNRANVALDARIPFVVPASGDEPNTLRFTNFACEVDDVSVPGSSLPINSDFPADPGFIAQDEEGNVYFVSPWANRRQRLGRNALEVRRGQRALFAEGANGPWMWMVLDGEVVALDRNLDEVGRTGFDVDRLEHSTGGSNGPVIAFHTAAGQAYVANASDLENPTLLEEDACDLEFSSGPDGLRLLYYSPCAERTLVAYDLATERRREIATEVVSYRVAGEHDSGPIVLYIQEPTQNSGVGALSVRFGTEPSVLLGEDGHLGMTRVEANGDVRAVLDWGENGGTLVRGKVGRSLSPLAEDVVYFAGLGVIADFDGTVGTLHQFDEDLRNLDRVQRSVSTQGIRYDSPTRRGLVLVDFDGVQGALTLIKDGKGSLLSENVRPNAYQFTVQLPTVTILSDHDFETGTATLKLRRIDDEEEIVISKGVVESLEVSWPTEGMLYSVFVGERAGIWFNEAR